jgi:multidrug efflux pump subunit AcrB
MFLSNVPKHGVENKLLVNLLSIFIIVAGTMTVIKMKREAFPNVSFDVVTVQTNYPGATAKEIETLITNPIEDELDTVSDLKEVSSSSAEGYSLISIQLEANVKNKDKLINEIQQAVDRVDTFPNDLEQLPMVREIKTEDSPVIEVALSANLPRKQLQDLGKSLELQLEDIPEVSRVARSGWKEEQIWVSADPQKLQQYRLSLDQITDVLRLRNINLPGGNLKKTNQELLVRTNAQYKTPEEIEEIVLRANPTGGVIKVKDVASVDYAFADSSTELRANGKDGFTLTVIKKERYDIIDLVEKVEQTIERFQKTAPSELQITLINDVSFFVERRLGILLKNGGVGLILVLLTLLVFLSPPVAFWTAFGLPVAAGLGIWLMSFFGIDINLISMFALIMVLGMLVDDAIIVAENIYRKMEDGMSPKQAAIEGGQEVLKPVSTAILTSVLVFLPLAFMTGIFGKFVYAIPIVVILMLLASWLESMWILPAHLTEGARVTKYFLRKAQEKKAKQKFSFIDWLKTRYRNLLAVVLPKHTMVAHVFYVLIVIGIYIGIQTTPVVLFPSKGIEIFYVRGEMELGTPLSVTKEKLTQVEQYIEEIPKHELKDYITVVGKMENDPNDPFAVRNTHVGQIAVFLSPLQERDREADAIMSELRAKLANVEGFKRLTLDEVNTGPPQGKPVAIRIRGEDLNRLDELSEKVKEELAQVPGVIDIRDDYEPGKDELVVRIREENLAKAGLNAQQVARLIRTVFEGEVASTIQEADEETDVLVRINDQGRANEEIFQELYIQNPLGRLIPVRNLITVQKQQGLNSITHYDGKRTVSVTADIDQSITSSLAVNTEMQKKLLPIEQDNLGYSLRYGGEYEDTQESLQSLFRAFAIAIFLVFIVLASTFNTLTQPFLIMLAIPFSLFSAIYALKFHGEPFSFLAMLGMIGLSGVAVNDSIVLIDFINTQVDKGKDLIESVIQACQTRLRPVMLTSITTVVGLAPVAYGIGGSDPFLKPMALAMSWGLAFGTLLILFLIPNAYLTIRKYPVASIVGLFTPLACLGLVQTMALGSATYAVALVLAFGLPYLAWAGVYSIKKIIKAAIGER